MRILNSGNFGKYWPLFYDDAWNPFKVKDVPNLSKCTMTTHNTMLWGVNPKLLSRDGRYLPITFKISLYPCVTAISCENFDGHHKIIQDSFNHEIEYSLNIADLNNIIYS
jgi:hypothetical protein